MIMINTVMTIKEHRNNAPKTDPPMMPPVCAIGCCRLDHDGVGRVQLLSMKGFAYICVIFGDGLKPSMMNSKLQDWREV